jgi:predicted Zn-dependent protease
MSLNAEFSPPRIYLSQISLAQTDAPTSEVTAALCGFADGHSTDAHANAVCGAVQLRQVDKPRSDTLQRLAAAAKLAPRDSLVRCEYAKALAQSGALTSARTEFEACVSLDPDSVEGHFRLARVYRQLGLTALADREAALRTAAEQHQSAANELRYKSATEFLFALQKPSSNP